MHVWEEVGGLQESWGVKGQTFCTLALGLYTYLSRLRILDVTNSELAAKTNQVATAEENLKRAEEEISKYR